MLNPLVLFSNFYLDSPSSVNVLLKKPARTMTTLHEDANVEEAEQAAEEEEVGKVSSEAVADKCQAASRLQPKEHHLEQHATVSDYKIIYPVPVWRARDFFFSFFVSYWDD